VFLACDYFGIATMVDEDGLVWLCNARDHIQFDIHPTELNVKQWYQRELKNPFRQHSERKWLSK